MKSDIPDIDYLELLINVNIIERDKDIDDLENNEFISEMYILDIESGDRYQIKDMAGSNFYIGEKIFNTIIEARKKNDTDEAGFVHIPLKTIAPEEYRDYEEDLDGSDEPDNDTEEDVVSSVDDIFFLRLSNSELTKPLSQKQGIYTVTYIENMVNL